MVPNETGFRVVPLLCGPKEGSELCKIQNVCFPEKVTKHSSSVECINTMIGNLFCLTDVSITNGFQEKVFNNIVPIIEIFFRYIFGNFY